MSPLTVAVFLCAVASALAWPRAQEPPLRPGIIPVLQRTEVRDDAGQFSLQYVTGDGTTVVEQGALKPNADNTDQVLVKQGSFQYTSPEGEQVAIEYVADELGFRPTGSHIPVAPAPVPQA